MAAAKESGRSATAEILSRLELSFLGDAPSQDLIPAKKARQMSEIARQSIPSTMKIRILEAVARAVSMGHTTASVVLKDLELDSIPASDSAQLYDAFSEMLAAAGYSFEWDAPDSLWIDFGSRDYSEDAPPWATDSPLSQSDTEDAPDSKIMAKEPRRRINTRKTKAS